MATAARASPRVGRRARIRVPDQLNSSGTDNGDQSRLAGPRDVFFSGTKTGKSRERIEKKNEKLERGLVRQQELNFFCKKKEALFFFFFCLLSFFLLFFLVFASSSLSQTRAGEPKKMPGHLDKSSKKPSAPASLGGKEPAPPNDAPSKALRGGAGASSSDEAKASGEAKVSSEKHAVPPPTPSKTPPTPGSGVEGVEPGPTPVKQTGSTGPAVTAPAEKPAAGGEASTFVVVGSSSSSLPSSASLAASSSASSSSSSFVSYPSHSSSSSSGPPLRLMKVDPEAPVFPDSPDSAVSGSLEVPAMAKAALLANLQQGVKNLDKDQRQILSGLFADMNLAAPESVQKKEKKRERLAAVASNPSHAAKGKKKQQQLSRGLALPAPQPTLAGPQQAQAQQPEGSSPSTSEEAAATGESRGDDKDGRDDHSDGDDDIDDAEESLLSDSLLSDAIQGLKFLSEGRMVDRSKIYVENGSLMVYAPKVRYFFDFDVFSPRRIGGPFPLFHPLFSASMSPLLASQSHPPPPLPVPPPFTFTPPKTIAPLGLFLRRETTERASPSPSPSTRRSSPTPLPAVAPPSLCPGAA